MFPENPFLQLTVPRASKSLERLEESLWSPVANVCCEFGGIIGGPCDVDAARRLKFREVDLPFSWGQLFDYGWFKLRLPESFESGLYLHWQDDGEGTLYRDGVPYYGFDVAHRYAPLPKDPGELLVEGLCLQSGIWHPKAHGLGPAGSRLTTASLVRRDDAVWAVHQDLSALLDLAMQLGREEHPDDPPKTWGVGYQAPFEIISPTLRKVLRALDDAVNALDQGGVKAAKKSLNQAFENLAGSSERIRAILIGHAHIDLVWLWPEHVAKYKTVHTFATMNRLMDCYPEFRFFHSQPASYEWVECLSPKLHADVSKRIRSGRWEPGGATYVESDTLMACGEALARGFVIGQAEFKKIQGRPSPVLWIPDVFGYSACLPQIMRQSGVTSFFTTKLTWSNINRFPYSSFVWKGSDGSEVTVHVTQENGYNQTVSATELRRGAKAYRQSDIHDEFLAPTGFGDGGGGVTEEMCERARRFRDLAGVPESTWGRVDKFFESLEAVKSRLPAYQGELYLEYHRGVLTTHSDLKFAFRGAERALQTWEAARCAAGGGAIDPTAWKRVIFAQFHDYIPGSSIWEVYDEAIPELQKIAETALDSAAKDLGSKKRNSTASLFNPLPIPRIYHLPSGDAVTIPGLTGGPASEFERVDAPSVRMSKHRIQTDCVNVEFDPSGAIRTLAFHGTTVPSTGPLAQLVTYPDFPHEFEAWDIDRQSLSMPDHPKVRAEVVSESPAANLAEIRFRRPIGSNSQITTCYRIDAFSPIVHIDYEIDWHEENRLLKVHFPTRYSGRMARFGSPFGSVLRSQQAGRSADEAMFEGAGSRWAVVADDGETAGLGIITESKYGFSCREGNLGVSLLRSPRVTGEDFGHRKIFPTQLRPSGARTTFSDQGQHRISIALCPHSTATPRAELAPALAESLFTIPIAYSGTPVSAGLLALEGGESLIPCWAKPADDGNGWILRLHETLGRRGQVTVKLEPGFVAGATTLLEESTASLKNNTLHFDPYSLHSVRIAASS